MLGGCAQSMPAIWSGAVAGCRIIAAGCGGWQLSARSGDFGRALDSPHSDTLRVERQREFEDYNVKLANFRTLCARQKLNAFLHRAVIDAVFEW